MARRTVSLASRKQSTARGFGAPGRRRRGELGLAERPRDRRWANLRRRLLQHGCITTVPRLYAESASQHNDVVRITAVVIPRAGIIVIEPTIWCDIAKRECDMCRRVVQWIWVMFGLRRTIAHCHDGYEQWGLCDACVISLTQPGVLRAWLTQGILLNWQANV